MAIPVDEKTADFIALKRELQRFQSERLNQTYADLKTDPQYAAISDFFFNRLYAPQDFTFRNDSLKTLQSRLEGRIHRSITTAMGKVVELNQLTDDLDDLMVEKMIATGIDPQWTPDSYRTIYRQLDNYDQRVYQITLTVDTARIFHGLSRKWIVGVSLKTVTVAAHLLNIGEILDFISEGYAAFRKIRNIDYFADTIAHRELAWHDALWQEG